MKIERIPINKIKPAAYNPRKDLQPGDPEYEELKRSIEEFDIVEPLVWNKRTGNLCGGHQRLKILIDRGDTEAEVSVVDMDDIREKALNAALNKISGEWDYTKLVTLFDDIEMSGLDIELTGFDFSEVNDIRISLQDDTQIIDPPTPPLPKKPTTKKGDLFQLGNHRLLCGDATSSKDVKRLLGKDVKANVILTDPPYGIDIVNDRTIGGKRPPLKLEGAQNYDENIKAGQYQSVKGDDKPFDPTHLLDLADIILIFGANNFTDKLPVGHHWLVWDKKCEIGSDRNKFSDVELIWTNIDRKSCNIYRHLWSGILRKGKRDIELTKRVHPTQKPVKLCYDILRDYSKEGDIILDLYGGSGTTLISCEQLKDRACYMAEISEAYCDVIIQRFISIKGDNNVFLLRDGEKIKWRDLK